MLSESERTEIRAQLDRIGGSREFIRAPRLRQFLRFVVSECLAGNEAKLKETSIAVEIFGREAGYDPTKDAVVRTTATRVRQKLSTYYRTDGRTDPWLIELPQDGYIPRITPNAHAARSEPAMESGRQADATLAGNNSTAAPPQGENDSRVNEGQSEGVLPDLPHSLREPHRLKTAVISAVGTLVAATAVGLAWTAWERAPVVTSIVRFTNDGAPKHGPLFADSSNLCFEEIVNGQVVPVSVPLRTGGKVVRLDIPLEDAELLDLNQRSGFLICARNAQGKRCLWSWFPGHDPQLLCTGDAGFGAWISDAEFVEAARTQGRFRLASRSGLAKTISLSGWIEDLRWS